MKHEYENNIKCPYCDHEDTDSWELEEDESEWTCGSCDETFNVTRDISVTYSTSKIPCKNEEHEYSIDKFHIFQRDYKKGEWIELDESNWKYVRFDICNKCEEDHLIYLTKEQYFIELENYKKKKNETIDDYGFSIDNIVIFLYDENGDLIREIKVSDFESWLTDNNYMDWINDSSDHNGEHVQSSGTFADFEEWSLDKTNLDVIKVLEQYLNEQK